MNMLYLPYLMVLFFQTALLVLLSAIFSGLNVGLMSLPVNDLKRKASLGDVRAKLVLPLRQNTHLTLASIIFSNIAIISASSLLLEDRFNGLVAGIITTFLIVIFGEILPQAYFTRFALSFCAFFAPFLRFCIILTYPVAKPMQLLLDALIKNDSGQLHSRGELGLILSEHLIQRGSELDEDEAEIMRSVLQLSEKRVSQIMTPLNQVYSLQYEMPVDNVVIDDIKHHNYSRIPILTRNSKECRGILLMKDLIDIDFDGHSYTFEELPLQAAPRVGSKTALDTLFRKFIAARSHMMIVMKEDDIIGVVTIEDLIEEILGHEIIDESDLKRTQLSAGRQ